MSDHALLSPSSAHRWMRCPGSVALSQGLESPDSEYSREGTFAHGIAAQALMRGLPVRALIGTTNGEFTVDEEMAAHLQVYVDVVDLLLLMARSPDARAVFEKRVVATRDVWGTADAVVLDGADLHVVDLKFGAGIYVPAEHNEQLLIYALGVWHELLTEEQRQAIKRVHLHVVQPRRPDADGEVHRECVVAIADLLAFDVGMRVAAELTKMPGADLVTGDHCTFCPGKHKCSQLSNEALAAAQEVFADGQLDKPLAPPMLATITVERVAEILRAADRWDTWIKGVREYATNLLWHGTEVPGFKLVQKLSNRRWVSDAAAQAALRAAGIEPFCEPELISPAQAEKKLGKRKDLIAPLTDRVVTGAALVPATDPRPAIRAGEVFSEVPLIE